ncbi:alpha/beta hydrolase [soil metagenome]
MGVLMALLVAGAIYAMFFRENLIISKAEAKERYSTPSSHFINWRGAEIHYTDEGQGTPVMMIHGFGGNFTNFDSLAAIMKTDHRVVRVDLPGFGLSDLPEPHDSLSEMYGSFLSHMLDTLQLDSLYVVGNSMGGWMGWELAVAQPGKVKGLVLIGSAGYEIEKVKANIGRIDMLDNAFFRKLTERGVPLWMSEKTAQRMRSKWETFIPEEVLVNNGIANRQGNFNNLITLGNSGVMPDTAKIMQVACPTLIIAGKQDVIVPWEHTEKFKRDIANSKVLVYDTCGHIPQMEYPHRVERDTEAFFSVGAL